MKPPYAIGSVPSLSGHAIAYRWRSLPRVRRHRALLITMQGQRINRSPPVGHFYFGFLVFSEKNPVCRDRTHVPTCQKVTRCLLSYRGRPAAVCVCVSFPSILDIKFVGRTSRGHTGGRSHRIFNPPSFCGACLDFCREKDSAIPFPRRP